MGNEIVNRIAQSKLITIDLEEYYHHGERILVDIESWLFQGLVLREKDFREAVKSHNWEQYQDKNVAITCSVDAIIPLWAYMLITIKLEPYANMVIMGTIEDLEKILYKHALSNINPKEYQDQKVVIKGCGKLPVPEFAYVEITRILRPYTSSIMYGEPCSTVPLYKRKE